MVRVQRRLLLAIASLLFPAFPAIGLPAETSQGNAWLSDRELAISRWFSHLTFLQDRARKSWPEWHDGGKQLGVTSLRYQLAFAGYGCAAMAAKTPAYRELVGEQLRDFDKARWQRPDAETMYAQSNLLMACCSGGWPPVSNAFVPLVAVQVEGRGSPTARRVLRWLEAKHGRQADMDGDGHIESYYYHTEDALRIATTGNLAAALVTDGDSLRRLFRTPRGPILTAPTVAHVDYPNVYVRAAEYIAPVLRFAVLKGTPGFRGKTEIRCTQCPGKPVVLRDGEPFEEYEQTGSTLVIRTDVEREHVFKVIFAAAPPRNAPPEARTSGDIKTQ